MNAIEETRDPQELAIMKKKKRLERLKQKKLVRKQKLMEKKKSLLKNFLAREVKYGQNTLRKYQAEWEKLLRTIALPRQIEEVELAKQNFERIIDAKDYIISCLMDKLRQNEDHYVMCLNMHISKIDETISRYHSQLEGLRKDYDMQIRFLADRENEFITEMETSTNTRTTHLKIMIHGIGVEDKKEEMDMRADFCAKMDLEMDRQEVMLLLPRIEFEGMLRYIWDSKNDVFRNFQLKTKSWKKNYETMKAAKDKFEKLSTKQLKRIDNLNKAIRQLKTQENEVTKNELLELDSNLKFFHEFYMLLKQKLAGELKIDKHKHEVLVLLSREAYSNIKMILKQGRNIVRLLKCCRRLETEDEKIRPYPFNADRKEVDKNEHLFFFWQKMGKVNSSRSALIEEKMELELDKKYLIKAIVDLCECISCPKLPPICQKQVSFFDGGTTTKKRGMRNR